MAKKKATMTLKDFHGGSIPSDLPLPSAPGVIVRPSNHVGFDRQSSWGNPMGRSDHRLRPGSAGSVRNLDDKTPFLSNASQIGRNFDEDERKPLDGGSAPRRTISDESIRGGVGGVTEAKLDYRSAGNVPTRPATTPVPHVSGGFSSYAARIGDASNVGVNSQNVGGGSYSRNDGRVMGVNSGASSVVGSSHNAWGLRKEPAVVMEPVATSWSGPDAVSKLAHASALEKVSSGRWHSKQQSQVEVEIIRHPEIETEEYTKGGVYDKYGYNSVDVIGGREIHDVALSRHANRSSAIDDRARVGVQELPAYERSRSPMQPEIKERKIQVDVGGVPQQASRNSGIIGAPELQQPVSSEPLERPKLKLLPRSKPVENFEPPVGLKQPYPQPSDRGHLTTGSEAYGHASSAHGPETGNPGVERPKLNLRPRPQGSEQLEGGIEKGRSTLFGGARPRELVLKERGVDDVVIAHNHELVQSPNRMKQDSPKPGTLPFHSTSARHNGKADNIPIDHGIGKQNERRGHRTDVEKTDLQQRRNWRNNNNNDSRKNNREIEKQQSQERPPSPETWRKPIEQPPSTPPGQQFGKATSAVDLAQAFSRSVSDPKITDRFPGQRGLPGPGQIPFSRLTGPANPRPQLNGY